MRITQKCLRRYSGSVGIAAWLFGMCCLLLVGCGDPDTRAQTAIRNQAVTLEEGFTELSLSMRIPKDLSANDILLLGSDGIVSAERTTLKTSSGELATVVALGAQGVVLGAGAKLEGTAVSVGDVRLASQGTITGNVITEGAFLPQDGSANTHGDVLVQPIASKELTWNVRWPDTNQGDVLRWPDTPNVDLAAGAYDSIHLYSRSTVTLQTGEYFFESLVTEPQAHLRVDASAGPVKVYVRGQLRLNAAPELLAGESGNLLVTLVGDETAFIADAFLGAILAPEGRIELRRPSDNQAHRGSFWAREVDVASDATVEHVPFREGLVCEGTFNGLKCTDEPAASAESSGGTLFFPKGTELTQAVLSSRDSLVVADGVQAGLEGSLITSGKGSVTVSSASVPGIAAVGPVELGGGASVSGDVSSASSVQLASGASVTGGIHQFAALSPPDSYPANALFPSPFDGDFVIQQGRSRIIFPGNYGSVTVEPGGKVYLTSGEYTFEQLLLRDGSQVSVNAREGWLSLAVRNQLHLGAEVLSLGDHDVDLSILYLGTQPVTVKGSYQGALIAPSANVSIEEGSHQGRFYGASLSVSGQVQLANPVSSWGPTVPFYSPPSAVAPLPPDLGLPSLVTSGDGIVASSQPGATVRLPIAERIPVQGGNAGQGSVTISFVDDGAAEQCIYRGQSSIAHPATLRELAEGREYLFESCSNGAHPGDVLEVTDIAVVVVGDDQHGEVAIDLPTPDCDNVLPPPLSTGESRRWAEEFQWPSGAGSRVQEFYDTDKPALYYSKIYITGQEDLDLLDTLLIHWSEMPLFPDEAPMDWNNFCGTIHFPDDGEGLWVSAIIPGALYNVLLDAQESDQLEAEERARIPKIRLVDTPQALSTPVGSMDLVALYEAGFRYLHLDELPDDEAIDALLLEQKGPGQFFASLVEFVGNVVRGSVRAITLTTGLVDRAFGTVEVDLDFDVMNTDARFDTPSGEPTVMQRAWDPEGREISLDGARVSIYNVATRIIFPVPTEFRGKLDSYGRVKLKVGRDRLENSVEHKRTCVTLNNDAAKLKTFVIPSVVCYKDLDNEDFNNFSSPSSVKIPIENWHTAALAEATDAHQYVKTILGKDLRKVEIVVGASADVLDGKDQDAWAPCMGYSNGLTDIAGVLNVLNFHFAGPMLDPIGAAAAGILADTDVIIGPKNEKRKEKTRGLVTHEYGHFAFVGLLQELGDGWDARNTLAFDTIAAGSGNPDPDEDVRIVNEAFADFFCGQVGSCSDYFNPDGSDESDLAKFDPQRLDFRIALMTRYPGMDQNIWSQNIHVNAIGRLSTLMQDLFDGRSPGDPLGPNNADAWAYATTGGQLRHSAGLARRAVPLAPTAPMTWPYLTARDPGHADEELYVLGGPKMLAMLQAFRATRDNVFGGSYSVPALERAVGVVAVEEGSWCDACVLMAPHFVDASGMSRAELRQECTTNAALAAALGNLDDSWKLDVNCSTCASGQGVSPSTGYCEPCMVDETVQWPEVQYGSCLTISTEVAERSDASDNCPMDAIVEFTNLDRDVPPKSLYWEVLDPVSPLSCSAVAVDWQATWSGGPFGATASQAGSGAGGYSTCPTCSSGGKCTYSPLEVSALGWEPASASLVLSTPHHGPFAVKMSNYDESCVVIR